MIAPVLLQRQQLDRLWDIDRSEIIDTLYRLQDGKLQAYPDYYDVRGCPTGDHQMINLNIQRRRAAGFR